MNLSRWELTVYLAAAFFVGHMVTMLALEYKRRLILHILEKAKRRPPQ